MLRINKEQQKAFSSLKNSAGFYQLKQMLQSELDSSITGLMTAELDKVQQLQGNTQLLKELVAIL